MMYGQTVIKNPRRYLMEYDYFMADVHTTHGNVTAKYTLVEYFDSWFIVKTTPVDAELVDKWHGGSYHDAQGIFNQYEKRIVINKKEVQQ